MTDRVSVIMAAFNAQETVLESIHSVLGQSFHNLELIIVDDGSTDSTLNIVQSIQDPRVHVFSQPNSGPSAARNKAVSHASGTWLACIDADDIWVENKLQLQLERASKVPTAAVVYGWADIVDADGRFLFSDRRLLHEGNVFQQLLAGNFIVSGSNALIKRQEFDSIGGFNIGLHAAEDWELHTRLAHIFDFACTGTVVVKYRLQNNSLSTNLKRMESDWWIASNRLFALNKDNRVRQQDSAATFYFYLATRALQTQRGINRLTLFFKFITAALRQAPTAWPQAIILASPFGSLKGLWRMRS